MLCLDIILRDWHQGSAEDYFFDGPWASSVAYARLAAMLAAGTHFHKQTLLLRFKLCSQ